MKIPWSIVNIFHRINCLIKTKIYNNCTVLSRSLSSSDVCLFNLSHPDLVLLGDFVYPLCLLVSISLPLHPTLPFPFNLTCVIGLLLGLQFKFFSGHDSRVSTGHGFCCGLINWLILGCPLLTKADCMCFVCFCLVAFLMVVSS